MSLRLLVPLAAALLTTLVVAVTSWHRSATGSPVTTNHVPATAPAVDAEPIEPLPAPKGEALLRITGLVQGNVHPDVIKLDFATLDALAREEVTIHEPFLKREKRFTGVRMGELLERAGAESSAKSVYMHALDDYHVDLPIADIAADGLLATRMDGKPIEIADGGPIRLVFTGENRTAAITDNWIWSIDSMRAQR